MTTGMATERRADDGASIVRIERPGGRCVDLTIESPALDREAMVRLLLPAGFDAEPDRTWPVLFLLHGAIEAESFRSWTYYTDVEELTEPTDLLVVMPEAGDRGFYTDWWNGGAGGPPRWETFHLDEVRQLVERNFRAGERRVVAGLSMGGFGAMSYAARHPGLFAGAASFSGVLDTSELDIADGIVEPDLWGDRVAQASIWREHNPTAIADRLRGTALYVACGNGRPGELDLAESAFDPLERDLAKANERFLARLDSLEIPVTVRAHGNGTHTWPYWERGLHEALPVLLDALDVRPGSLTGKDSR